MEGESMSEWKEKKLYEVCQKITDGSHYSPVAVIKGYPMLSVKDMREYDFDFSSCKNISNEDFCKMRQNDCIPQVGDVLVAKDGSYLKEIFCCKEYRDIAILSSIAIFRPNQNIILPDFLCYLLKTPFIFNYISKNCVSGSALPRIVLKSFKDVCIPVPDLFTQSEIAGILSSLDAKIETNNKLNEKLEEMAQAIFKSWFVDFEPFKDKPFHETELGMIPEGWEVGSLSDIATITMGQSPCGTSYNENGEGIIFYQGRTEFGFRFPSIRLYTTAPSRFAEVGSTLMSVRAPVGDINMALLRCCIGRGVASIKSNCDCDSYIYYLMKSLKKRFDIYNGEGTVFGSVGRDTLRGLLITIPPSSVISDFEMNISKIDSRIKTNELESQRLASLRDTLFPRLMSGELIV